MHMVKCVQCNIDFQIADQDRAFYVRMNVPEPKCCPDCRRQRRHGFINDNVFYTRSCDNCQKSFVSIFPPKSEYKIYCQSCWFSDERDDAAEARDYDPNRPFFEQFDDLMHAAPQLGIIGVKNENCDYCESTANCRNCYLISECSNCEDCLFSYWIQLSKNCLDCNYTHQSERCYELENCFNCFHLRYSQNCRDCSDSGFLDNCSGCKNCLFCTNLRNKEYYIFNRPYSKENYEKEIAKINWSDYQTIEMLKQKFQVFLKTQPRRHLQIENAENCTGDYIRDAKNCHDVYHCYDAEECAYGEHVWRGAKWCYDSNTAGRNAELLYETTNCGIGSYNVKFSRYCWGARDTEYSNSCKNVSDCFGCVSLKANARYRVLNKQYPETEYRVLVTKIKDEMLKKGEYGEFFPLSMALFGYNNSVSFDEAPLTREETLARGWKWEDQKSGVYGDKNALACEHCRRNYKIIAQEQKFYDEERIPAPRKCPDCRLRARLAIRNKKKMRSALCAKCETPVQTTYAYEYAPVIYCEPCYLKTVY